MKITCLGLCILLLTCLSCLAVQNAKPSTVAARSSQPTAIIPSAKFEQPRQGAAVYNPWQPMPDIFEATSSRRQADLRNQNLAHSSSAIPMLSCIGAGMALGGLISARWWDHRRDK
jgi:hypothetical protein